MKYRYFSIFIFLLIGLQDLKAQVQANFSVNYPTPNCAPSVISFANLSTGTAPLTFVWNFGLVAGTNSVQQNPSTSYLTCGTYNVTLKVTNGIGQVSTVTKQVHINCNPLANFNVSSASGCVPLNVTFNPGISNPGTGSIVSYQWDFGDGVGSTQSNPGHNYTAQGCKNVTLLLTNSVGCKSDTTIANAVCPSPPPTGNFTSTVPVGCSYPFNVTYSSTASGASPPFTYKWTFQGGSPATSTLANPVVVYNAPGSYWTQLIISNSNGCKDTIIKYNYVVVATNAANFTINNTSICNPGSVFAQASNSQFADSMLWTCTGGTLSGNNAPENLINFTAPGTYQLCLTMIYPGNCVASKCTTIVVKPSPSANFSETGNKVVCMPPLNITYTNTSTGTGLTYLWQFPGGSPSSSTLQNPPVVNYHSCGNYNVQLVVTNSQGCTDTLTDPSLININCPKASFVASAVSGCAPLDVTFNSTQSSGAPTKWYWNFGDAANPNIVQSTQQNPEHTYTTHGSFNVRLIIVNALGCTDTLLMSDYINIGTRANANFTANPTTACADVPIRFTNTSTNVTPWNTYSWDFIAEPPFSYMSGAESPTYTYNDTGLFSVSLISCYSGCCDTIIYPNLIHILAPVAVVKLTTSCAQTHVVTLDGTKSLGANTYAWSIPGGTPDTSNSPTVVAYFKNTGNYVATLSVYNATTHCTNTSTQNIYIRDVKADFYAVDSTGCIPFNFCFMNTSQDASTYQWIFYDAAGQVVNTTYTANPCTQYTIPGIFSTKLIATDINGCSNTMKMDSNFVAHGLATNLQASIKGGCVPLIVNFTGAAPANSVSVPVSYEWDFGDPASGASNNATTLTATHTYNHAGLYTVTFSATDNHGCVTTYSVPDYINAVKPATSFSAVDTLACLGSSVCFLDSTTGGIPPYYFTWNFGDNSGVGSGLASPCHVFTDTGIFTITQYVIDSWSCKDTMVRPLYIRVISPRARFTADTTNTNCPPLAVTFKNLSTDVDAKTSYFWNFGDGSTSTVANPFHIYNKAGDYNVTLIIHTSSGCSDTLLSPDFITVKGPTASIATTIKKGCNPQMVCFHASSSTSMSYIWNAGDGTVISSNADSACYTYTSTGTFLPNVILSDSEGCAYAYPIDTITITSLDAGFKPNRDYLCQFGSVQFTDTSHSGVPIKGYKWNFGDPSSGVADNTTLQDPEHLFASNGAYPVTLTITNSYGCVASAVDTIHVTPVPDVLFSLNSSVCPGLPVLFKNSTQSLAPVSYYTWNFGDLSSGSSNTSSQQNPSHNYTTPGTYTISLIVGAVSGCIDSTNTTITVHALPDVNAGPGQTICFGATTTLDASGAFTYRWKPDSTLSNTTIPNPVAKPSQQTVYYVSGQDNYGCTGADSVTINVLEPFQMQVDPNVEVCAGQSVQLGASGAASYQWSPPTGLDNPFVASPFATPITNTTYTVMGYDGKCFHDVDSVAVTVHVVPSVYAGQEQVILAGQTAPIGMPFDSLTYTWSPVEGLACTTCSNTVAKPIESTTYVLTVTNKFGCRAEDSVIILVGCSDDILFVPNAFTPNGDGIDDVFYIRSGGLSRLDFLRIYDRWGQMVFETKDISDGWDGNFKGKPCVPGVYVFVMEATCSNNQTIIKQGNITLIR